MITNLTKDKTPVEISEEFTESNSFGIHDVAKAFHAITTQIYKNPEYSVIAEICANAWDSHILAKKMDIPFNIHLPNRFEPFFSVRDFGVSMNHEFMLEKYSQAFLSTKDNTNKQNGAFGIGRLTCLALNDTYTAICYLDGVKRTYSIYKEDSVPKITLLSSEETEEKNGFEVSVNVPKNYNYDTFASNCGKILAFYPIKMNVSGYANFSYSLPQYELRVEENGLNFGFPKDKSSFIVMGVYSYPIDMGSIDDLSSKERRVLSNGIHLFVKLGDCSVNLSRDGLFYDQKTKNKIKGAIIKIAEKYLEIVIKKMEQAPNYWELKHLYWSNFNHNGDCYDLIDKGQKNPEINWNGAKISDFTFDIPKSSKTKMKVASFDWKMRCEVNEVSTLLVNTQKLIINDLDKQVGVKARIKELGKKYQGTSFVIFEKVDKEFLDTYKFQDSDFISLKSIVPPITNRTYNYDRAKCKIFEFDAKKYYSHSYLSSNWNVPENFDEEDLDTAEGCYVVLEERFAVNELNHHYFTNIRNITEKIKIFDPKFELPTIYGVRHSVKEDIMERVEKNLTPLNKFLEQKATEVIMNSVFDAKLYTLEFNYKNSIEKYNNFWNFVQYTNGIRGIDLWKKLHAKLNERISNNSYAQIAKLANQCRINISTLKQNDSIVEVRSEICDMMADIMNKLKSHYDIFNHLSFSHYSTPNESIKEIIRLIDGAKGEIILDEEKISFILGESKDENLNKEEELELV